MFFMSYTILSLIADGQQLVSDQLTWINVKKEVATFLYGTKASRFEGEVTRQNGDFLKLQGIATVEWKINVRAAGSYKINWIYSLKSDSLNGRKVELAFGKTMLDFNLTPTYGAFGSGTYEKIFMTDVIRLQSGDQLLTLKTKATTGITNTLDLRGIELIPVAARSVIQSDSANAKRSRASTDWLVTSRYGVMFHWTSKNISKDGTIKPFEQAVNDFDLGRFVDMVETTGAGYVIFTIGHAEAYCPAPLKSWEQYHPAHTTKRDLIAEMADALALKNIKLICYLPTHVIAKYKKVPEKEFTKINKDILTEMGLRYGKKIAGYWFDGWYQCFEEYPDFSFKEFFNACKKGNPDRIIALNSWIYPQVTEWQEYWAGETASPVELPAEGTVKQGPVKELRYQALLIMEPYWVQEKTEMPDPRFNAEQLSRYILDCNAKGGAVTINLGIYQDGTVGVKALEVMKEVRQRVRN